ncbi:MAG: hypothetical protein LC754_06205, partial [Acidobacteria bacterium]|nr:hypothetical protein [Acidobacteriota bacterium]
MILKTTSLSLNDTGDTVSLKLSVANGDATIASLTYGAGGTVSAPGDQSLTRSPDAEITNEGGSYVPHKSATFAAGRAFSPGTRADGTPFGSPAISRIEVSPASVAADIGATQTFNARAFGNMNAGEFVIPNVSFIWD